MKGFVFNIQRFSINDGPGIRSTVFLKGCNLRCLWCHNPESLKAAQEILFFEEKCVGCKKCETVCPSHAHYFTGEGNKVFDRSKCNYCGLCIENCMYDALACAAKYMEPGEVMDVLLKDMDYYRNSGGGVTFSGGEPLLQKEFLMEVAEKTKSEGIHNALDTALNVEWEDIEHVLPYINLVLLDLKVMDSTIHKNVTGVGNQRILQNAFKLSQTHVDIIVRIPVIPGINDTDENMGKTAEFLKDFKNLTRVELLPYHDMGVNKHLTLGNRNKHRVFEIPSDESIRQLTRCFRKYGIEVISG
ncbi:MAG: glycyl-radical enzyme activating protein [Clostridia bacterium]|nr:glycyl-radical enzyme activating protein [Clostridia bacterium]